MTYANIKHSLQLQNDLVTNQIPDRTPNEGSDTHLKNYLGQIPKGQLHEFPFLTCLRTQHLATEVTEQELKTD